LTRSGAEISDEAPAVGEKFLKSFPKKLLVKWRIAHTVDAEA
jgi:hypothetical protein